MTRDGATYYYLADGLGSVVAVTDDQGAFVESYEYDPFGNVSIYDGNGAPLSESAIGNPYMFTGRRLDEETGLFYYRARHYDPRIGRFLQRDPIGYIDGMNLYSYSKNNPVSYTDPLGLCVFSEEETRRITEFSRDALMNESWWSANIFSIFFFAFSFVPGDPNFGLGQLDFAYRHPSVKYTVNGRILSAGEYGNYLTGYATTYRFGAYGGMMSRVGGQAYHNIKLLQNRFKGLQVWDDDTWINQGESDAYLEIYSQ